MTTILSAPEAERQSMRRFWVDVLEPYTDDEIRQAFLSFARDGGRYAKPGEIVELIRAERRRIAELRRAADMGSALPPPDRRELNPDPELAERNRKVAEDLVRRMSEAVAAETGSSGGSGPEGEDGRQ